MYRPQFRKSLVLVAEACQEVHAHGHMLPLLVGRAAEEFYTLGGVVTGDLEVVTEAHLPFETALIARGFDQADAGAATAARLRHPDMDVAVEVVGAVAHDGRTDSARAPRVGVEDGGAHLCFLPLEDLVAERLGAYARGWPERDQTLLKHAQALAAAEDVVGYEIDPAYLDRRIRQETAGALDRGVLGRW